MALSHQIIVAGVDFSEFGAGALTQAIELASKQSDAQLYVVHAARPEGPTLLLDFPGDVRSVTIEEAKEFFSQHVAEQLAEQRARGIDLTQERIHIQVRVGPAADELVRAAAEVSADLILVGTHGRTGWRRLLIGSVAEAVVRNAGCPVLVVRPKDYSTSESGEG